jgi:hypothetical protein
LKFLEGDGLKRCVEMGCVSCDVVCRFKLILICCVLCVLSCVLDEGKNGYFAFKNHVEVT